MATGKVKSAFGNLITVQFEGDVSQGEMAFIKLDEATQCAAEIIEINKDMAKLQVFEDIHSIQLDTKVEFRKHLLEAQLGPGLLSSIYDGLQNPLEKLAAKTGLFLQRGVHINALDEKKKWNFKKLCNVGDIVSKGDFLGFVKENMFDHKIMVPFNIEGKLKIIKIEDDVDLTIIEIVAVLQDENNNNIEVSMLQKWPIKNPLSIGKKNLPSEVMHTGLRIIDTQLPVLKGSTFGSPGPFGAGKTVLQHHLSKYSSVDIVIVAACGERAGEVVEVLKELPKLIDNKTKKPLMERTVIICNTSSMPTAAREASVYMGVTIAEYYRQMGLDVLLLADSTSRWAQAMREISGRLEEIPGEEAFPAYLASRIFAFYERAGVIEVGKDVKGSLTIGGTVSPAGGNFEEPVTQSTLSVVGAFLGLSRLRSDARRYPAIDCLISWSKYIEKAASFFEKKAPKWFEYVKKALSFLKKSDEISRRMEVVGEEGVSIFDMIIYLKGELYDFCYLQQNAFDKEDAFCPIDRQIELFLFMQKIFDKDLQKTFKSSNDARKFFLNLQGEIKHMNTLAFKSEEYNSYYKKLEKIIEDS